MGETAQNFVASVVMNDSFHDDTAQRGHASG